MKKIVIIGPESTGKSTLCKQLAAYYQSLWVPEFAREYLLALKKQYTFEDLLIIANGQMVLEDNFIKRMNNQIEINTPQKKETSHSPLTPLPTSNSPSNQVIRASFSGQSHAPLFIDTDMYVMKVWCEYVFNKCHRWILDKIVERKYDFYLLCNIDLPWTPDELREYPDLDSRKILFKMYVDILINQSIPWVTISGSDEQRFNRAIQVLSEI